MVKRSFAWTFYFQLSKIRPALYTGNVSGKTPSAHSISRSPSAVFFIQSHWGKNPHFIQKSHLENLNFHIRFQIPIFHKIPIFFLFCKNIFKISFLTKFAFKNLIFHKIHIFKFPFFTKIFSIFFSCKIYIFKIAFFFL